VGGGMNSVLIVSSSEKGRILLQELLTVDSHKEIIIANTGSEARRILIERDFDLCVINAPLSDEFGTDFALSIVNKAITQVMLMVKSELSDEVSEKVEDFGVFVISKPINRQVFWNALKLTTASFNRMMGLKKENVQLQKKIEDIRFIDRAKCVLIEYLKMTESEAHKFIEKQSMDMRISKREVAARILKTYES
jgi:two-component system, response regulator PdtaR